MSIAAPQLDVERDGATLRARGRVAPDLVYLDGHFPGHPIVPGVVQLDWAIGLAREHLGLDRAPSGVPVVKFRAPLLPEQDFALTVHAGRSLSFQIDSDGGVVSSGRVSLDGDVPQHDPAPAPAPAEPASWPLRIPQAGRMRLLDRVVAHDEGGTVCAARICATTPFCRDGRAPAWLAVELLAQGLAAHGGLAGGARVVGRRGFLVAVRALSFATRGFAEGEELWVRAEPVRAKGSFAAADGEVGTGAPPAGRAEARRRALCRGSVTAWIEGADAAASLLTVGAAGAGGNP